MNECVVIANPEDVAAADQAAAALGGFVELSDAVPPGTAYVLGRGFLYDTFAEEVRRKLDDVP
jgi:hypothetical protein